MKWPLAGAALLFAAGILAGHAAPELPFPVLLVAALAAVLGSLRTRCPHGLGAFLLGAGLLLAGAAHLRGFTRIWNPQDLRLRAEKGETLVRLEGRLESAPLPRHHRRHDRVFTNSVAVLAVDSCRALSSTEVRQPAFGRVVVSSSFLPASDFRAGARIEVDGILREPSGPEAPGLFDYAAYLRWRGIHFELRTADPADWRFAAGASPPPPSPAERFREWALEVLARGLDPREEEVGLLQAMTLGWKTGLTDELEEPFLRAGTLHVFAISGLHIALLATLAEHVVRVVFPARRLGGLVVIVLAWLYTAVTGLQPSAVRATLMTSCFIGGRLLERPAHPVNSLAAAALAILLWDPRQLFHAGFQLSFAVVGCLALLVPPATALLRTATAPDPLLPDRLRSRWRRCLDPAWRHLSLGLAVGAISWVGSAPLGATHFQLVTLAGFVANLVVVPLSSAALAATAGSLAVAPFATEPVELFNHAAWFLMRAMVVVSRAAAAIPETSWNLAPPPPTATAAWYLLLAATGAGAWRRPRARWAIGGIALVLLALALPTYVRRATTPRLVVLPLSGGHALWFQHARHTALIDTGDAQAAERITLPFLRAQGVNHLDLLALTHGDIRHTGGATSVVARCPVVQFATSPVRFRSSPHRRMLDALRTFHLPPAAPPPAPWRILHPLAGDAFPRADDGCLVLSLDLPAGRVLHLGDLDRAGQELLLQRQPDPDLAAGVLILSPSARGLPPLDALLPRVRPDLILVADSLHPATARARPDFRSALARHGVPVLYASDTGALDLQWRDGALEIRDARGSPIELPPPLQPDPPPPLPPEGEP